MSQKPESLPRAAIESPPVPAAWTCRKGPYPRDSGVHEVFQEVVARFGDRPAIRTETSELTYAELDARANQLANYLLAQGLNAGDRVGILLDRSSELVIAELAILKAGGVYVPIDCAAPPERVGFFIRDAGLTRLICTQETARALEAQEFPILPLDAESAKIARASQQSPARSNRGDDPAYVMYTSGSTGTPKGIEIPHRGILRLVFGQSYFSAGPENCTLLLGSPAFDGTTYEVWSALLHGACCAVFPDRWIDPQRLETIIRSLRATCLSISTGLFNQIIDRRPQALETARHILVVGEALSPSHMRRAMALLPEVRFANGYGPTECTTFAVSWVIEEPSTWGCESVPLGFPLNNTECHIVDEDLRPLPIGEVGELLVGGDGLALGYVNLPDLTAQRFIPHPFSSAAGARLYRTGDRCYWLPNGMIAYVGRTDDQVKLRGYRIEMGEVESALRRCPGIENAAVIVHEFSSGARGLVAFAVPESSHQWQEEATLAAVADLLPEAMMPNRLFPVDTLPLTLQGKLDRRKLAAMIANAFSSDQSTPQSPPISPIVSASSPEIAGRILFAWITVLKDESIHADTDFFRSGGDSLLAVELTAKIGELLGRKIPVGTLYRFSTPRRFARWCEENPSAEDDLAALECAELELAGDGAGAPVFFVPGHLGYYYIPKEMADILAGRHPYFDRLAFPAIGGENDPNVTIEKIAAGLVAQVRRVCQHGPYVFVGFSFGGLLAYEMACQLVEAGEPVEHVVLWDAYPLLGYQRRSAISVFAMLTRLAFSPRRWRDPEWLRDRAEGFGKRLTALSQRVRHTLAGDSAPEVEPVREVNPVTVATSIAEAFQPRPYQGRVSVLACEHDRTEDWIFENYVVDYEGWAKLVPAERLRLYGFPCNHMDALDEPFRTKFTEKTLEVIEAPEGS